MSDLRRQKKDKSEGKNKRKKKIKPEYIIYAVLGVVIVAALVAVPTIVALTSSGTAAYVPPCCE